MEFTVFGAVVKCGSGSQTASGLESPKIAFCVEIIFHQARRDEGAYPLGM
jgi:hypothetical protein